MIHTRTQLLAELRTIAGSPRRAKQALDHAAALVGIRDKERLNQNELLLICEALAREGSAVQQWAEALASDTIHDSAGGGADAA